MFVRTDCFGLTDKGRVRGSNEDQFLVADLVKSMLVLQTSLPADHHTRLFGGPKGKLLAVADGMGGVAGGKRASGLAIETIAQYVLKTIPLFLEWSEGQAPALEADLKAALKAALEACQKRIASAAVNDPKFSHMGTTLTMAYILFPHMYVVHAGDSRCYLIRGGKVGQITRDHTVAQQMVDQGILTAEQAEGSKWSHVLYNCVGGRSHSLAPDVYKVELKAGDGLLLCSDGLSKYAPKGSIEKAFGKNLSAEETAADLVRMANEAGGSDNITVVVGRFRHSPEPSSMEIQILKSDERL